MKPFIVPMTMINLIIYATVLTLLMFGIMNAFAVQSEIRYFDNRYIWDKDPTLCYHRDVSYNSAYDVYELERVLRESINAWEDGLNVYANGTFKINMVIAEKHPAWDSSIEFQHYTWFFPECDINVIYQGPPKLDTITGMYFHGWVAHQTGSMHRATVIMWTYDWIQKNTMDLGNVAQFKMANATGGKVSAELKTSWWDMEKSSLWAIKSTTKHEIGHALGLKHFMYNGTLSGCDPKCSYYNSPSPEKSIMFYIQPKRILEQDVRDITDWDIMSLLAKYSTDGFGGFNNYLKWKFVTND